MSSNLRKRSFSFSSICLRYYLTHIRFICKPLRFTRELYQHEKTKTAYPILKEEYTLIIQTITPLKSM